MVLMQTSNDPPPLATLILATFLLGLVGRSNTKIYKLVGLPICFAFMKLVLLLHVALEMVLPL
jgi:hypothetical protein